MVKFGGRPQFRLALQSPNSSAPSPMWMEASVSQSKLLICVARLGDRRLLLSWCPLVNMSGEGRGGEVRGLRAEDLVKLVNFVKSEEVGSLSRLFFSHSDLGSVSPLHSYFWLGWNWPGSWLGLDWVWGEALCSSIETGVVFILFPSLTFTKPVGPVSLVSPELSCW